MLRGDILLSASFGLGWTRILPRGCAMDPTCAMNQEPYDVNFSALKEHPHHWHVVRLLVSTIALYLMPLPPSAFCVVGPMSLPSPRGKAEGTEGRGGWEDQKSTQLDRQEGIYLLLPLTGKVARRRDGLGSEPGIQVCSHGVG